MTRMYEEQPVSSPGVWNRLEYRPLEGFVFAVSPFNFTAIGGNLTGAPAHGQHGPVEAGVDRDALGLLHDADLPGGRAPRRHQPRLRLRARTSATRARELDLAGVHFTGSTAVFQGMWKTIGQNIAGYRSYPRIVGETGGKDFIVAHPTADAEASRPRSCAAPSSTRAKCSAASRVYAPASMWPAIEQLVSQVGELKYGDVSDFSNFMGAVIDAASFATQKEAIEEAKADAKSEVVVGGGYDDSEGYFVQPTGHPHRGSRLPPPPGRALRPGRHDLRLPGRQLGGDARADRPHGSYALTGAIFAGEREA